MEMPNNIWTVVKLIIKNGTHYWSS